jgi:alkylhydroperoxidase/carboxymuconolactone decarboxylase family protein YurZ
MIERKVSAKYNTVLKMHAAEVKGCGPFFGSINYLRHCRLGRVVTFEGSPSSIAQTLILRRSQMDEKTKIMISLGAATAANCIPCFEHYFEKAGAVGLTPEEVQGAAEIGEQVNKGAQMAIRRTVNGAVFQGRACALGTQESGKTEKSCCG